MRFLLASGLILILFSSTLSASIGMVRHWDSDGSYYIGLADLGNRNSGDLSNEFVFLGGHPDNLHKNSWPNCYCFGEDDVRFAYVDAFYQLTNIIRYANEFLEKLGLESLDKTELQLQHIPGMLPAGGSQKALSITHSTTMIDPSILAHEVGHLVHRKILSRDVEKPKNVSPEKASRIKGVKEGIANLFAAMYFNNPNIGFAIRFDVPIRVDLELELDTLISVKDEYQKLLASEQIQAAYPQTINLFKELFATFPEEQLSISEPYQSSAIITRPIWLAAQKNPDVYHNFFAALQLTKGNETYKEFMEKLKTFYAYP